MSCCAASQLDVYMVRVSFDQKPYRRALMETYGARCVASPSDETQSGRAVLAEHPDSPGSLGIAISEAVEMAAPNDDAKYSLGSVLNHVLLHQTVVGQEAMEQMEMAGEASNLSLLFSLRSSASNFSKPLEVSFCLTWDRRGRHRDFTFIESHCSRDGRFMFHSSAEFLFSRFFGWAARPGKKAGPKPDHGVSS